MCNLNRQPNKTNAFTLIELLLVTGVISLLSSVIFFNVTEGRVKAEDAHMKTEVAQVSRAIALYKNDHNGSVPLRSSGGGTSQNFNELHSEVDPNSDYIPTMQALVAEGYLNSIPTSPHGVSYVYGISDDYGDAVFGTRLNRTIPNNSKTYCSAAPPKSYTFSSCANSGICTVGQISETSSCFMFSQAPQNCNCSTGTSLNPSSFPNQVCATARQSGSCPFATNEQSIITQSSGLLSETTLKNQLALVGGGSFTPIPTGYMTCQHNSVSMQSATALCDGSSNSDYCECL